jgi:hypothetical protein
MRRILLAAAAGFLAFTGFALAEDLLGQPYEHVTLQYLGDVTSTCPSNEPGIAHRNFQRIFPSGERSRRFVVPAGKHLVVTDVYWTAPYFVTGTIPVSGESAMLKLAIHAPNGDHKAQIFVSTPVVISPRNQSAKVGTSEHMTTGFRVGAGKILCASISNLAAGFDAGTLDPETIFLNGYLVAQ